MSKICENTFKAIKILLVIILGIISLFAFISLFNTDNFKASFIMFLGFFLPLLYLIISLFKKTPENKSKKITTRNSPEQTLINHSLEFPMTITIEETPYGFYKMYHNIDICVISYQKPDFSKLVIGELLNFKQEPTNKYDENAVAVYQNEIKIGYLYTGTGQDMTNDFLNKGDYVMGYLTFIDENNSWLKMSMGYYKVQHRKNRKSNQDN